MNYATQNLEDDHLYILRLIDVMERMTTHPAPRGGSFRGGGGVN